MKSEVAIMTYIITLLIIWSISAVILFADFKNVKNLWGSAVTFFIGLRYLGDAINELVIPCINNNPALINYLQYSSCFITKVSLLFYPFGLMMFSLSYTTSLSGNKKRGIVLFLFIWMMALFILIPLEDFINPTTKFSYKFITIWALNVLVADILLVLCYFRTTSLMLKKELLFICILVIPPTIIGWIINFILPQIGDSSPWRFNIIAILCLLMIYIFLIMRYGLLGAKLSLEKRRLDSTFRSITSGTKILNHAIKNEILKVSICSKNIKLCEGEIEEDVYNTYIRKNIENISASTDYLIKLVMRIQECIHDIVLKESYHNLSEIVESSINLAMPYIMEKNISVRRKYSYGEYGIVLMCDNIHLQEVFNNILKNAIEALGEGGEINIEIKRTNKDVALEIVDNGKGISRENLAHVFDPFFSTKKNSLNFGLGLSYCYNVIRKHGGTLEINSIEEKGTTVILKFPAKKVKKLVIPKYVSQENVV